MVLKKPIPQPGASNVDQVVEELEEDKTKFLLLDNVDKNKEEIKKLKKKKKSEDRTLLIQI